MQHSPVIVLGAQIQAVDKKVPDENVFDFDQIYSACQVGFKPFSSLTKFDRLDLHAHGNKNTIDCEIVDENGHFTNRKLDPDGLARIFHLSGLSELNCLKIQACSLGEGNFLVRLAEAFRRYGVLLNYLVAPRGKLGDFRKLRNCDGEWKVVSPTIGPNKKIILNGVPLPKEQAWRIVEGNPDLASRQVRARGA